MLKRYIVRQDTQIIVDVDLTSNNYSFSKYKNLFHTDFLFIDQTLKSVDYITEFVFDISQYGEAKVLKNHLTKIIQIIDPQGINIGGSFLGFIQEKFGINLSRDSWERREIENLDISNLEFVLKSINKEVHILEGNDAGSAKVAELKSRLSEGMDVSSSQTLDKFIKTEIEVKDIQKKVDSFKKRREDREVLQKRDKQIQDDLKVLEEKLKSVKTLLEYRGSINQNLSKLNTDIRMSDMASIKEQRIKERIFSLKKLSANQHQHILDVEANHKQSLFQGKFILFLLVVNILLSFLLFILSLKVAILIVTLIVTIILGILISFINTRVVNLPSVVINDNTELKLPASYSEQKIDSDKGLVYKAYKDAYEAELQKVEQSIQLRLGEEKESDLKNRFDLLAKEAQKIKDDLDTPSAGDSGDISTDEYYKLRRELDIKKIESENLLTKINLGDKQDDLEELLILLTEDSPTNKVIIPYLIKSGGSDLNVDLQGGIVVK